MSEPKQRGIVKSAEIDNEGRIIVRLRVCDDDIVQELTAYIDVPLPAYTILSPEAKRQLVLELPGKPIVNRTGRELSELFGVKRSVMSIGK